MKNDLKSILLLLCLSVAVVGIALAALIDSSGKLTKTSVTQP